MRLHHAGARRVRAIAGDRRGRHRTGLHCAYPTAEALIRDVGLEPVWLGGVEAFDVADGVTRLWFTLALQRKLGRRLAFKVLRDA